VTTRINKDGGNVFGGRESFCPIVSSTCNVDGRRGGKLCSGMAFCVLGGETGGERKQVKPTC